jgi:protease IV
MWLWVLIGGAAFAVFVLAVFTLVYLTLKGEQGGRYLVTGGSGGKIGVVKIEGIILDPEETVRQIRKFADDDSIKAIILHLNTPGGGAAASEEIYREVRRVRDEKKKFITASIETVGASGGYYIASAANKIFANEASVVGSIGVIMEYYNYGDLLRWARLNQVLIKAGKLKDVGNPARPMTPEERAYLQSLVDNMHSQFITAVAQGRGMKVDAIQPIADGRVWTGQQALALKLIDQIDDFRGAVQETAKEVGIKGEPSLVRPEKQRRTLVDLLFGDASSLLPNPANLLQENPGFYYLWK